MAQRINSVSMGQPDAYGNYMGQMIPSKSPSGATDLAAKKKKSALENTWGMGANQQAAQQSLANLNFIEAPKEEKYEIDPLAASASLASGAMTGLNTFKADSFKSTKGGMSASKKAKATGAGVGLATAAAGIGGDYLTKNKNEVAGGILSGAAIGAVVGGVAGGISGKMKQDKRIKAESEEKKKRKEYNQKIKNIKHQTMGRAADIDKYQNILNSVKSNGGRYKKGGILKYSSLDVERAEKYLNGLKLEAHREGGKLKDVPMIKLAGGGVMDNADKPITRKKKKITRSSHSAAPVFKSGGKTKMCKKGCSCKTCRPGKKAASLTLMLRRGGSIDISKENVIVNGPSHDDFNKTGVKGDKGLPVVKDGRKIAEIESDELVINALSSKKIEELKNKAKNGDKKAKEELGDFVMKELNDNTYDYSNVM